MVTAADIKLLPYFNAHLPVSPRVQGPGGNLQSAPRKAFTKAHQLHPYQPNPTRKLANSSQDNNTLHTYNAKRQVQLRTVYRAGQLVDTYA